MSKKYLAISFLVLSFMFLGGVAHAATDTQQIAKNHVPMVMGNVTAISGASITITTIGKTPTTYTVDTSNAKFVGNKTKSAADITSGARIAVQGTISGNNISATRVISMPAPKGGDLAKNTMGPVRGTVTANDNGTLTISTSERTGHGKTATSTSKSITVTPDAKAKVSMSGKKGASLSDLAVGANVMVIGGTKDANGNITGAKMISVIPTPKKK